MAIRARYIMQYTSGGVKFKEFIYANTLIEAKAKARKMADEKRLGVMFSLEYDPLNKNRR